jgi:hypothetical protein
MLPGACLSGRMQDRPLSRGMDNLNVMLPDRLENMLLGLLLYRLLTTLLYRLLDLSLGRLLSWLLLKNNLLGSLLVDLLRLLLLWCGLSSRRLCRDRDRLLRLPVQRRSKLWVNLAGVHRSLLAHLWLIARYHRGASTVAGKKCGG